MHMRKSLAYLSIAVFSGTALCAYLPASAAISGQVAEELQVGDFHLTGKSLAYRYKDMFMAANITGYNYIGGMMLPLAFTADMTGSFIQVDYQHGRAEGWVETPENTFLLDMPSRRLVIGKLERVLPQGVAAMVGNEMYVDASFLATLLPVNYQINYDTNIIDLQPQKDLRVFQRMDFVNRYFENIRKQAGLPYRPWTLEEAIAASTPDNPVIQQPAVPPSLRHAGKGATETPTQPGLTPQLDAAPAPLAEEAEQSVAQEEPVLAAPGISRAAPVGAVESKDEVPPLDEDAQESESLRVAGLNITLDTKGKDELQAVANPMLNENNLLILEPEIDNIRGDYIEVYQHESGYYLPLGYLMDMLELGIGVNPETMEASGFFINEDNTFYLNGKTNEAIIKGEKISFPAGLVVANPFEIYVDAQLLAKLLPLDFEVNMTELALSIFPREELPLQAKLKRGQKWAKIAMWKKHNEGGKEKTPMVYTPYKAVSVPTADVRLGSSYSSDSGSTRTQASVVASGDLGYLNTETFALSQIDEEDNYTTLRFKAGRTDPEGKLLGPLEAKEAYVGDVQSYPMPLVSSSQLGRGAKISNRELLRPDQFDETDFYGDAQPGWEVELYQNNVLIDFQLVGDDGRYSFTNVPISYGDNTFRIVQYGPQGQKQEEVREFNIDDQMPKPGKVHYAVSVNEQRKGLMDFTESETAQPTNEGLAAIGMAEYGINEKLAIGTGFAHVPVQELGGNVAEYDFASANLRTSILGLRSTIDTAYDVSNGGWAAGVTSLARYGLTNIRAEQRYYEEFDSAENLRSFLRPLTMEEILDGETDRQIESRQQTRSDFTIGRPFSLPFLGNVSTSGNVLYETFEAGETDFSLSGRVSKNYLGSNFAAGLRYRTLDSQELGDEDSVDGTLSVRHNFSKDLLFRTALRYQMVPDLEPSAVSLSLQKQWTEDVNSRLEYTESLSDEGIRRLAGYLNWDFDKFYLSPRVAVDEDAEYLVGLELQFSLGMDDRTRNWHMTSERQATSGSVSARVFMDENADGVMNEGEKPLEGVTLNNKRQTTDESGVAFIPRVRAHHPSKVRVDKGSVASFGATPKEAAYAVVTHPGVTTQLEYPVVPTLEVEGHAYLEENGEQLEYPGLLLELVNSDGEVVRQMRTEFDGYYYLEDVYPGVYTLRVAEKEIEGKNLVVQPHTIDTAALRNKGEYEGFAGGYDFMVARQGTGDEAPDTAFAQAEEAPTDEKPADESQLAKAAPSEPAEVAAPSPVQEEATPPDAAVEAEVVEAPAPPAPVMPSTTTLPATALLPAEKRNVFVQAGMYCDYTNAQRQVDTLTVAGFNASLKGRSHNGQSCYLVHVGPALDLAAAEAITLELQNMGLEKPVIVEENTQLYE